MIVFLGNFLSVAAATWAIAGPADTFGEIASRFGLAAAVVAWFMWRDWKREQALTATLDTRYEQMVNLLTNQIQANTAVMKKCEERQEKKGK